MSHCVYQLDIDRPTAVADVTFAQNSLVPVHDPLAVSPLEFHPASLPDCLHTQQISERNDLLQLECSTPNTNLKPKQESPLQNEDEQTLPVTLSSSNGNDLLLDTIDNNAPIDPQLELGSPVEYQLGTRNDADNSHDVEVSPFSALDATYDENEGVFIESLDSVGQSFTDGTPLLPGSPPHQVPESNLVLTGTPQTCLYPRLSEVMPLALAGQSARTQYIRSSIYTFGLHTPAVALEPGGAPWRLDGLPISRDSRSAIVKSRTSTNRKRGKSKIPQPPSQYCHVCLGKSSKVTVLACSNHARNVCRKVICYKCFITQGWDWDAALSDAEWTCCHCRNACPDRAQCNVYSKTNRRRSENLTRRKHRS